MATLTESIRRLTVWLVVLTVAVLAATVTRRCRHRWSLRR
jgi:hypothetical protein